MDKNNVLEILYRVRTKLENGRVDMLTETERSTMQNRLQRCIERVQIENNDPTNKEELRLYKTALDKYENLLGNIYVFEVENLINRYKNNFASNEDVISAIRDINAELKSSIQEIDPTLLQLCDSLIASLELKTKDPNNYKSDEEFSSEDNELLENLNNKVIDSQKEVTDYRKKLGAINKSFVEIDKIIKDVEAKNTILRNRLEVFIPSTDLERKEAVQNQIEAFTKKLNAYKEIRKIYNREKINVEKSIVLAEDFNSDYGNVRAQADRDLRLNEVYDTYAREMDMEKIEVLQACIKVLNYNGKDNSFNLDDEVNELELHPEVKEAEVQNTFINPIQVDNISEEKQQMDSEIQNIMNNEPQVVDVPSHDGWAEISLENQQEDNIVTPIEPVQTVEVQPEVNPLTDIPSIEPQVEEQKIEEPTVENVTPVVEVQPEINPLMDIPLVEPQVEQTPVEPSINIDPIVLEESKVEAMPVVEDEQPQTVVDNTEEFKALTTKELEELLAKINEENEKEEVQLTKEEAQLLEPQVEKIEPENMTMEQANKTLANLNQELEEQVKEEKVEQPIDPEVSINLGEENISINQVNASDVQEKDYYEFTDDGKYHNELVKQVRTPEYVEKVSAWMDSEHNLLNPSAEVQQISQNPDEIIVSASNGETNSFYVGNNETPVDTQVYQDNITQFQEPEMEESFARAR